jgi:ribosomal protein S11
MMKSLMAVGAVMTLAACGGTASTNDAAASNAAEPAANGTNYVETIRTMPEGQRRATFLRALQDAKQACQQIVDVRASEPVDGNAAWGVRCEDGRGWLIAIAPDGNAKVTGPVAAGR